MTLEWMGLLAPSQFHFSIPSVEVSQETIFIFNQMREGGRAVTSVVVWILFDCYGKIDFLSCVPCPFLSIDSVLLDMRLYAACFI
jgi:hypothetical protein